MSASALHSGLLTGLPAGERALETQAQAPSFAAVYEAHVRYVYRCLRGLGVRAAHLDDAVQDVFVVVHDKLAAFDGQAKLSTWLYAIVLRIARKYRARQAGEAPAEAVEQADWRSAEDELLSREQLAHAHAALSALSDDKREVFVLAEIEQMSAPEIAAITGAPLNTIYSRLRAARSAFERQLSQLALRGAHGRSR